MSQDKQPHSTHQADSIMLTLVLILAVLGLLILFSASEYNGRVRFHDSAYYFKKQLFATALGLGAMYLVSSIDYHFFVRLAPAAYLLSMLLSTAVLLFGQEINGSKRWLNLGPLSFQPSEFAKVSVVLFLTWQIERSHKRTDGFWFMCRTMLTLLPIVGLVGSNNLSTVFAKYKRQSGGSGQYGHVKITVEPNESGKGYEFVNAVVGGAIPKEFIPAVDAGIQGALQSGVVAGFPVVDVKVTLYDGSYHEVDSSEMAFKIAGSMAFKEAMRKADPVLLEHIMKVSVIVPDEYLGTVIGDLTSRRGQIQGQEARPGAQQVDALVPLANMFGYATDLRSNTQGRGQYTMEPHSYAEIPKSIRDKIVEERGKKAE